MTVPKPSAIFAIFLCFQAMKLIKSIFLLRFQEKKFIENVKICNIKNAVTLVYFFFVNSFMHNVVKWPNILQKSCGVNTARLLKYVWPFSNIMHERVKKKGPLCSDTTTRIPISGNKWNKNKWKSTFKERDGF